MRLRIRHYRSTAEVRHGTRTTRLREAAWIKICNSTFAFMDYLDGIPLEKIEPPETDGEAPWEPEGATTIAIKRPQEFEPSLTGDEMIAWLERSLIGELQ